MSAFVRHWLANGVIAYRRHQASVLLSSLDDRRLRDIGLERYAIEEHVEAGFPWQSLEREPKTLLRPSIQGCG